MRKDWALAATLCLLLAGIAPRAAWAAVVNQSIREMNHKVWTVANGAPADIWDMKQGPQGFIWLATGGGLYRFDGLRFELYPLADGAAFRSHDMTALQIAGVEDIWIGTNDGYISHVTHGHVANFPESAVLPTGPVYSLALTSDGTTWAATGGGLVRIRDNKLTRVQEQDGYPAGDLAMWVFRDASGALWVATDRQLLVMPAGASRFVRTGIPCGKDAVLAQAPDGTLWLSDASKGTHALPGLTSTHFPAALTTAVAQPMPYGQGKRIMFDASGALWGTHAIGNGIEGVFRVAASANFADGRSLSASDLTDTFGPTDGLPSAVTSALLTDGNGDVWVASNFGLSTFHATRFHAFNPNTQAPRMQAWVSPNADTPLLVLQKPCLYTVAHAQASLVDCHAPPAWYGIFQAADGYYTNVNDSLVRWDVRGNRVSMDYPGKRPMIQLRSAAVDRVGKVWVSIDDGVYRLTDMTWEAMRAWSPSHTGRPNGISFDRDGLLWLGYADGTIVRTDGHSSKRFTQADGLDIGSIETIDAFGAVVQAGGSRGAAYLHADHFMSLPMSRLHLDASVTGMAIASTGDWWLNTTRGVVQIAEAQLALLRADPAYAPAFRLYSADDGLPGIALTQTLWNSITSDHDGRLWFATNQGVAWIDPTVVGDVTAPPKVHIDTIEADGNRQPLDAHVELPPLTSTVTVRYTAPNFLAPHRVRFRYMLDGIDKGWLDGGNARQATYANLGPGVYTFRISAASSEGVWSSEPASLVFQIRPAFHQTAAFQWFMVVCVGLVALATILSAHRASLRRARDRMGARHAERERIARDLHDTLLQSVQGLLLLSQAVADRMKPDDPSRPHMDLALTRAEEVLVEGRDRVQNLRVTSHGPEEMVEKLTQVGEALATEHGIQFMAGQVGKAELLTCGLCEEVFLTAREALLNAFKHAHATRVHLEVEYATDQMLVRVVDNGAGMPQDILRAGGREGHFGIPGMYERAVTVQGELAILVRPRGGTEVVLAIPAHVIYRCRKRRWRDVAWWRALLSLGR